MRRHTFDALSFLAGILFAGLGLAFLGGHIDVTDLRLSWVWPIPLIALGVLMLFTSRRRDTEDSRDAVPPPAEERPRSESDAGASVGHLDEES